MRGADATVEGGAGRSRTSCELKQLSWREKTSAEEESEDETPDSASPSHFSATFPSPKPLKASERRRRPTREKEVRRRVLYVHIQLKEETNEMAAFCLFHRPDTSHPLPPPSSSIQGLSTLQ